MTVSDVHREIAMARLKERRAKNKSEKALAYVAEHREKLEKVMQRSMNQVLRQLPADPFAALLVKVSEHTKLGLSVVGLRFRDHDCGDSVACEVLGAARNGQFTAHSGILDKGLINASLTAAVGAVVAVATQEGRSVEDLDADGVIAPWARRWSTDLVKMEEELQDMSVIALASFLNQVFGSAFADAGTLDFNELQSKIFGAVLGRVPFPQFDGEEDLVWLFGHIGGFVVDAIAALLDKSAYAAVRAGFTDRGLEVSPRACCREDMQSWQHGWPEFVQTSMHGATPRRRLCIGATLWAATMPEALAAAAVGGGQATKLIFVDPSATTARQAAMDGIERGGGPEDEDEAPEADEFFPPLNAVSVAWGLVCTLSASAGGESRSIPAGEDFRGALASFRTALEGVMPQYLAAENAAAAAAAVSKDHGAHEDVADGDGALRTPGSGETASVIPAAATVDTSYGSRVAARLQRGCIYAVLDPDADAAWNAESTTYVFASDGEARTQEQLLDYYVVLCESEPLLRVLLSPFSKRDPARASGYRQLRARLGPLGVLVVDEGVEDIAGDSEIAEELVDAAGCVGDVTLFAAGAAADVGCVGRFRSVRTSALGLAGDHQTGSVIASKGVAPESGVYDFDMYKKAGSFNIPLVGFLDVCLALPEQRRIFLLPQECSNLFALERRLQGIFVSAFRLDLPPDDGQPPLRLTADQFREGLRRLGFRDGKGDAQADIVFAVLDLCNSSYSGVISADEMKLLQRFTGPASLEEIDDFRMWACAASRKRQHVLHAEGDTSAASAPAPSPLAELWRLMDRTGSGQASFAQFRSALRKLGHPAAVARDDARVLSLFTSADLRRKGQLSQADLFTLGLLSAHFQIQRGFRVRSFLEIRFGSLKSAFRAMDEFRGGTIQASRWQELMDTQHSYEHPEDVRCCCHFLDKDGSGTLTSKDFELLGSLDQEILSAEISSLNDHLVSQWGNLADAYDGFLLRKAPPKSLDALKAAATPTDAPGDVEMTASESLQGAKRTSKGLESCDFAKGCRRSGFRGSGSFDLRLIFNFLDSPHLGRLNADEFLMLARKTACADLERISEQVSAAVSSIRSFAMNRRQISKQPISFSVEDAEERSLGILFEDLRVAMHDDD
eukprot:TRINITY_DN38291_c0_g1_i1.p1 TRINITY_DN38291_c0_g1~~TRINITY_DN38291_c0_g1_i1.p1  ORF type:complete len:1129 (-),score=220.10 TRINITY_DN38291_c0_g1_i1:136-3522(-)